MEPLHLVEQLEVRRGRQLVHLAHHAPLITELKAGPLTVKAGGKTKTFQLEGGLLEVGSNRAVILADGKVQEG